MQLNNVRLVNSPLPVTLTTGNGKILATGRLNDPGSAGISFTDAIAFPGLINSHDHLDFNCFSPLGNRVYNNYTEWGNHIHAVYKEQINAVLAIPAPLRASWGMYKNLLAGVTTVVNHGPVIKIDNPLINIYQEPQNLHSVKFQKKWKWKLNNPVLKDKACVVHTGEGTDKASAHEIDELLKWNLLNRKLIGVHGVAMNAAQAKGFAGLVWCPEPNRILLDSHAAINVLKENTKVVFGSDSTLTGHWNIWQHIRLARSLQLADDAALFAMLTSSPAQLWGLQNGSIQPGRDADIVVARTKTGQAAWEDFFSVNPSDILMVLHKGTIRMFDSSLHPQLTSQCIDTSGFSRVNICGATKFIEGNLSALLNAIRSYYPGVTLPPGIDEAVKQQP